MPDFEDLYEILQVHPAAYPEIIQASYRQLRQLYDPDRNPYPNASELIDAIDHAYEVLVDPAQRAMYNQYRKTRELIPDIIQARSFQLVDDEGNVRAELGCRLLKHSGVVGGDSYETEPIMEMKDSNGQVRFSVSLDYFDQPRLVMRDVEDDNDRFSVSLEMDEGAAQLVMRDSDDIDRLSVVAHKGSSSPTLAMRDQNGIIRFEAGLFSGDEGDQPRLVMRDRRGRTRFEVELLEVELDQSVAKVGDDYELSPLSYAFPARLKMRDEEGKARLEVGLFGSDGTESPGLFVLDDQETPRLEIGYTDDSPRVVMKDKDGIDRLELELAEVEIDGGYDYIPRLLVLDKDENIRFEMGLPGS